MTIKSSKSSWLEIAQREYCEKIKRLQEFQILEVASSGRDRSDHIAKIKSETEALERHLKPDDFLVIFDERGQTLSSPDFAKKLNMILLSGKKRTVFVVGGAFGIEESLRKRGHLCLSLSTFVFNHWVAQTVVLEQIYRGLTILKNLPYHNETP